MTDSFFFFLVIWWIGTWDESPKSHYCFQNPIPPWVQIVRIGSRKLWPCLKHQIKKKTKKLWNQKTECALNLLDCSRIWVWICILRIFHFSFQTTTAASTCSPQCTHTVTSDWPLTDERGVKAHDAIRGERPECSPCFRGRRVHGSN